MIRRFASRVGLCELREATALNQAWKPPYKKPTVKPFEYNNMMSGVEGKPKVEKLSLIHI